MKLRILTSVISAIISSLASIILYKYYSDKDSNIIFIYVTSQQIAGLLAIFLLYGAQFEIKDKLTLSAWKIIFFSVLTIPFLPILSVTCLLFSRISIQKFGKIQSTDKILKVLLVLLCVLILYYFNSNWLLLTVAFFPIIPMLLIGESAFEAPNLFLINKNTVISIALRSSIDLALLFPMILINFLTKFYLSPENYLEIQKLIFCLSGLAIATTVLEKIIFDKNLTHSYNLKRARNNAIFFLTTYIGVGILAYSISIDEEYFWYLIIAPTINLIFTKILAKIRSCLDIKDCISLALKYILFALLFTILSLVLIADGLNTVNSVMISIMGLSLSQLAILYFLHKEK